MRLVQHISQLACHISIFKCHFVQEHTEIRITIEFDIDIILYDDLIIEEKNLTIPHPRYTQRNFVLVPLLEIDNKLVDPRSKIMVKELFGDISSEEILDKIKFPYSKA